MAHDKKNSQEEGGLCKKIHSAVSFSPLRTKTAKASRQAGHPSHGKEPSVVSKQGDDDEKAAKYAARVAKKPLVHFAAGQADKSSKVDGGGKKIESNDRFSDYIRKMKKKLGVASSNVGTARKSSRTATRRDSFNDKVSDYINRAKMKIRTTTTIKRDKGAGT